ncbi:MAG: hypothetical protein V7634_4177, partial [Bradyrhizobium sp.]
VKRQALCGSGPSPAFADPVAPVWLTVLLSQVAQSVDGQAGGIADALVGQPLNMSR